MADVVSVRVGDGQRENWEAFVAESDRHRNLSDLVRHATTQFVANDGALGGGASLDVDVEGEFAAVREDLDDLTEGVESLKRLVAEPPGGQVIHGRLYDHLPPVEPFSQRWDRLTDPDAPTSERLVVWSGRPSDLAERFDLELADVETALRHMDELETVSVTAGEVQDRGGRRYRAYWRTNDRRASVAEQAGELMDPDGGDEGGV